MRALAVATHHDLRKIQGRINMEELGWGGGDGCPGDDAG
jgi:hypothetical protein